MMADGTSIRGGLLRSPTRRRRRPCGGVSGLSAAAGQRIPPPSPDVGQKKMNR